MWRARAREREKEEGREHNNTCAYTSVHTPVVVTFEGVNTCGGGFAGSAAVLPPHFSPSLPLRLLVSLLRLALVCFGSSSAMHVVRVLGLLNVRRDACDTGAEKQIVCAYA